MYIMYIREKVWRNRLDSLLMDLWEQQTRGGSTLCSDLFNKSFSALIYEHFIFSIITLIKNSIVSAIIKLNVWDQKNFNVPSVSIYDLIWCQPSLIVSHLTKKGKVFSEKGKYVTNGFYRAVCKLII